MATKFYKCPHCGNVIVKVVDSGVTPVCCGEPMKELNPKDADGAYEKHVPHVTKVDDCTEPDDCLALKLTKAAHKEALGLDKEANRKKLLQRELYVQGKVATFKGYPALTNLCNYQLE